MNFSIINLRRASVLVFFCVGSIFSVVPTAQASYITSVSSQWTDISGGIYYNTGNIGIGTTTPAGYLHIYNTNTSIDTLRLQLNAGGGGNWAINPFILGVSNGGLSFVNKLNGTTPLVIQATTDNIGVGTTAPEERLTIAGNAYIRDGYKLYLRNPSTAGTGAQTYIWGDGLNLKLKGDDNVQILGDGGGLIAHFDYTGNVGIGLTNPGKQLEVSGTGQAKFNGLAYGITPALTQTDALATVEYVNAKTGGSGGVGTGTSGQTLRHNGTGWVGDSTLFNNGTNVGVGTTAPGQKLDISGNINYTGALYRNGIDQGFENGAVRISYNQYGYITGTSRDNWNSNTGVTWSVYRYIYSGTAWGSRDAEEQEILTSMGMSGIQHFAPSPIVVAKVEWTGPLGWVSFPLQIWVTGQTTVASYCKSLSGSPLSGEWASGMTTSWGLCGAHHGVVAPGTYQHLHPSAAGAGSALVIWPAEVRGYFPLDRNNPKWGYWDDLPNDQGFINAGSTLTGLVRSTASGNSWFTGGNVGIGTTAPGKQLEVGGTGQAKFNGLAYGITPALTQTDALATVEYVNASLTNGTGPWKKTTTNIYPSTITDNVGIGTSAPGSYKLNVNGNIYSDSVTIGASTSAVITSYDATRLLISGVYIGGGSVEANSHLMYNYQKFYTIGGGWQNWGTVNGTTNKIDLAAIGTINSGAITSTGNSSFSGSVGVGTTGPGSKLVISNGTSGISLQPGTADGLGFNRNAADGTIYDASKSAWQFSARDAYFSLEGYNGAVTSWNVTKAGLVGIGLTNPGKQLEVGGTGQAKFNGLAYGVTPALTQTDALATVEYVNASLVNGTGVWKRTAPYIYPSTLADNVGIGVTNPDGTLHVMTSSAGAVTAYSQSTLTLESGGTNNFLSMLSPAGQNQGILFGDSDANWRGQIEYNHANDMMYFYTAASGGTMVMNNIGNVGIGITNPVEKLDVVGDAKLSGSLYSQAGKHIISTPFYNYGGAPTVGSYLVLSTPIVHNEGNMFSLKITGFDYTAGRPVQIQCVGYAYGAGTLIAKRCEVNGTNLPVYLTTETRADQGNQQVVVVYIGNTSSAFYFPNLMVEYTGWQNKKPADFKWSFQSSPVPAENFNNSFIEDYSGSSYFNAGAVGIGSTTPNFTLSVAGTSKFTGYTYGVTPGITQTDALATVEYVNASLTNGTGPWKKTTTNIYPSTITDNVGIGTSAPGSPLHVKGVGDQYSLRLESTNTVGPGIRFQGSGTYDGKTWAIIAGGSSNPLGVNKFAIYDETAGLARMTINTDGNVGIGTTNPSAKLELKLIDTAPTYTGIGSDVQQTDFGIYRINNSMTAGQRATLFLNASGNNGMNNAQVYLNAVQEANSYSSAAVFTIQVRGAGATGSPERFRIDSSGNVGIGITNPVAPVEIRDSTWAAASVRPTVLKLDSYTDANNEGPFLDFTSRWTGGWQTWVVGRIGGVYDASTANGGALVFYTNYGVNADDTTLREQVRINPAGNVGIGLTNPGKQLEVGGTGQAKFNGLAYGVTPGITQTDALATVEYVNASLTNGTGPWKKTTTSIYPSTITDNVGIGTTNPKFGLDVTKTIASQKAIVMPGVSMIGNYLYGPDNSPNWYTSLGSYVNNNVTAPDGTTSASTLTLQSSSWDLYQNFSTTVGTSYKIGVWVKLGSASNFCLAPNNAVSWDTIPGKCFTAVDGLNTTTWTHISWPFVGPASGNINMHIGGNGNTGMPQTAGTIYIWNFDITSGTSAAISSITDTVQLPGSSIWTSTGNVGIGQIAPLVKLDVIGLGGVPATSGTAQQGALRLEQVSNTNVLDMGTINASPWTAWIQSTDRTSLAANYPLALNPNGGNVGVGTTNPVAKLHVYNSGGEAFARIEAGGGAYAYLDLSTPASGTGYLIKNLATGNAVLDKSLYLWNSNGPIQFVPSGTVANAVTILTTGNLGIGLTNPNKQLEVGGTGQAKFNGLAYGVTPALTQTDALATVEYVNAKTGGSGGVGTGTSGQTLRHNGTGWVADSNLFNNGTNVGIGTAAPLIKFTVLSGSNMQAGFDSTNADQPTMVLGRTMDGNLNNYQVQMLRSLYDSSTGGYGMGFMTSDATAGRTLTAAMTAATTKMFLGANGYVGIGRINPDQTLTVNGGIGFGSANTSDKKLYSPADGTLEWMTHNAAGEHGFAVSHQGTKYVYLNTSGNSYLNGGNVGIGTTAPGQKLDVSGNIKGSHILQGTTIARPYATWGVGSDSTGAVIIKLPGGVGNYGMLNLQIDVYEYGATAAATYICGGHNWGSRWYNYSCNTIGTANKKIRLAFKDGQYAIVIGEPNSVWSYGQVSLTKVVDGIYYAGTMDLGGTYTITQDSSAESYTWISEDLNRFNAGQAYFSGSVGIGLTNPGKQLEVGGTGQAKFNGLAYGITPALTQTDALATVEYVNASLTNGTGPWKKTTTNIYPSTITDNVGIGTTAPTSKLTINTPVFTGQYGSYDDTRASLLVSGTNAYHSIQLSSTYNNATYPNYGLVLVNGPSTSDFDVWGVMHDGPANTSGGLQFGYLHGTGASANIHNPATIKVTFQKSGNVGIGTTAPGQTLHVYNSNGALGYKTARFDSNDTGNGTRVLISNSGNTAANNYGFISGGTLLGVDKFSIARLNTDSTYSDLDMMVFDTNGNVGIGTAAPNAKLSVAGTTRINGDFVANGTGFYLSPASTHYIPANNIPTTMIRTDDAEAGPESTLSGLVLYNGNGGQNTGSNLTFASREAVGAGNDVALAGIFGEKRSAGNSGAWSAGGLRFWTKNYGTFVDAMAIDSSGLVGIGLTNPGKQLEVGGTGQAKFNGLAYGITPALTQTDALATVEYVNASLVNGTGVWKRTAPYIYPSNLADNVGIGVTSPLRALSLYAASNPTFQIINSSTGSTASDGLMMQQSGLVSYVGNQELGDLQLFVDNGASNRVIQLQSGTGNVGIGATAPGAKLDVNSGDIKTSSILAGYDYNGTTFTGGGNFRKVFIQHNGAGNNPAHYIKLASIQFTVNSYVGAAVRGTIYSGASYRGGMPTEFTINCTEGPGSSAGCSLFKYGALADMFYFKYVANANGQYLDRIDIYYLSGWYATAYGTLEIYDGTTNVSVWSTGLDSGTSVSGTDLANNANWNFIGGNVGIGTTGPATKLQVVGGSIQMDNNQGLYFFTAGSGVAATNNGITGSDSVDTLTFRTAGQDRMIINTGNVGIGLTNPGKQLEVGGTGQAKFNGLAYGVTPGITQTDALATVEYVNSSVSGGSFLPLSGSSAMTGALNMGGRGDSTSNITGVNKLTVNTIDPLYKIKGINYSTYASSISGGVKEEYVGRIMVKNKVAVSEYEAVVDFSDVEQGSDLWVWRQVVDFNKDNVEVLVTPYGRLAQVYYIIEDNKLVIRANRAVEVSYRLIGRRFDWRKWPTRALDQSEQGMEIK